MNLIKYLIFLTFSLIAFGHTFAQTASTPLQRLTSLQQIKPFSQFILHEVESDCELKWGIFKDESCNEGDTEKAINAEAMAQLQSIINNDYEPIKQRCSNLPSRTQADQVELFHCQAYLSELENLKRFLVLEKCQQDNDIDGLNSRANLAVEAVSVPTCSNLFAKSLPYENLLGSSAITATSEALEIEQYKQLSELLLKDTIEQSVQSSLVFSNILHEEPVAIETSICNPKSQTNSTMGLGNIAMPGDRADQCRKSLRNDWERAKRETNGNVVRGLARGQSVLKSQEYLNEKINEVNNLLEDRKMALAQLEARIVQRRRELGNKKNTREGISAVSAMRNAGKKKINKVFEQSKQNILLTATLPGTDELLQTPMMQDILNTNKFELIEPLKISQVRGALIEARSIVDEQVQNLLKLKFDVAKQESFSDGSSLKFKDRKSDLMKLVKTNPMSVGRVLRDHPYLADNICAVNKEIKRKENFEKGWDKAFLVVGVAGFAGAAFLSGGILTGPAVAAGLALMATEGTMAHQRSVAAGTNHNQARAAYMAGLGDNSTLEEINQFLAQERSAKLERNLIVLTAPLALVGVKAHHVTKVNKLTPPSSVSDEVLEGTLEVNTKMRATPEQRQKYGKLDDTQRKAEAKRLYPELSDNQLSCLIQVHNVGKSEGRGYGTYKQKHITKKAKMLKACNFSPPQINHIISSGLAGNEGLPAHLLKMVDKIDDLENLPDSKISGVIRVPFSHRDKYMGLNKTLAEGLQREIRSSLPEVDMNTLKRFLDSSIKGAAPSRRLDFLKSDVLKKLSKEQITELEEYVNGLEDAHGLFHDSRKKLSLYKEVLARAKANAKSVPKAPEVPQVVKLVEEPKLPPRQLQSRAKDHFDNKRFREASEDYYSSISGDGQELDRLIQNYNVQSPSSRFLDNRNLQAAISNSINSDSEVLIRTYQKFVEVGKFSKARDFLYELSDSPIWSNLRSRTRSTPEQREGFRRFIESVRQHQRDEGVSNRFIRERLDRFESDMISD